ncbi:MAG: Gfo/Idh/MocA family oxidoreductase [Verrucomicrobia bacterium]|nr:Gfo/Idh/MocA family oxidoreductase [Verrucomicrobiota bacterium]
MSLASNPSVLPQPLNRRQFVQGTAAALAAIASNPRLVRAADANSKVTIGWMGCGGRGTWIADLFQQHGGYQIVACADYFQDRVDTFGDKFKIEASRRFTGLMGYKRMLEGKLDAVVIESPPYFHPEHAAASVEAGKHVYVAKPIAVDVPGCQSIAESGKKATAKKQVFLVDFQTRNNEFYIEAIKRVHAGAIGKITFGEARYHCGALHMRGAVDNSPAGRLRNWPFDIALSGDIITEQNIHTLDVMNWIMQTPPLSVAGTGGRKGRVHVGDCWDHFALVFQYPDNVGIIFSSKQYDDGGSDVGIVMDVFGSAGRISTKYGGNVFLIAKDKESYPGGKTGSIYKDGAVNNIASFHKQILAGDCSNTTVVPSVQSNIITIMGRTAAYEHRPVTWKEIIKSTKRMKPQFEGLKA